MFADDSKNDESLHKLQENLDKFSKWCNSNKLNINISKCNIISFLQKLKIVDFNFIMY